MLRPREMSTPVVGALERCSLILVENVLLNINLELRNLNLVIMHDWLTC